MFVPQQFPSAISRLHCIAAGIDSDSGPPNPPFPLKPDDGGRSQIPIPETAVCAAHALSIGDTASEGADTN